MKKNCWEILKCCREPGGKNTSALGVCPVTIEIRTNGINGGKNGGRCCWAIAGTFCEGGLAKKFIKCTECAFYALVTQEEKNITSILEIKHIIENP